MSLEYIVLFISCCIIGSVMGSFLNLAMYRIPLKQDIVYKHSYCPNCEHKLEFIDLIPILSYIFLRGKCRHCKMPIKPRYLYVELLMLAIYVTTFITYSLSAKTLVLLGFYTISILIIGMLIEKKYISKGTIITASILNMAYYIYKFVNGYDTISTNVFCTIIILIFVYLIVYFSKGKNKEILLYLSTVVSILNIYNLPYSLILLIIGHILVLIVRKSSRIRIDNLTLFNIISLILSLVYNLARI